MMRWERFTAGPATPKNERLYVSINSSGLMLINRKMYEEFGAPDAAVLLFDRKNSVIGLCPAHRELKDAFPIKQKDGYWFIQAAVFCKHYGIRVEKTEQFVSPIVDGEGILRLDLTNSVSAAQRKRRTAKQKSKVSN